MSLRVTRRQMIQSTSALGFAAAIGARRAHAATDVRVHSTRVISQQGDLYHGWPTLARRRNGQLLVVWSGGRESHVCPFGRLEMMRSDDDGKSWSWPRVLLDGAIDDRDAGLLETAQGSLLATTFTSLAYEPALAQAEQRAKESDGEVAGWPKEKLRRWLAARDRIDAAARRKELGVWMIRSTDGGITWSQRYDCLVDSPHGPIQLADGRLLYAGKELWSGKRRVGVCVSEDDGQSWSWLATIPTRDGDTHNNYHELHAVEAADGRIVCHVRNHNQKNARETLQCESSDGGKTWSTPQSIGVWGLPSHLLRLKDGRLLMSYGHRRKPLGVQARLSEDNGGAWSDALIISGDGVSGDLGYPSTVELDDGSLLTVWYENMKPSPKAVLRQAHWSL